MAVDVMYSFLSLFGVGTISFLVRKRFLDNEGKTDPFYLTLVEILAYDVINMVFVVGILKPFGRVQIGVFEGKVFVLYGTTALFLAVILAAALGYAAAAMTEQNIWDQWLGSMIDIWRKDKKKAWMYAGAVILSVCIFIVGNGSAAQWADMNIYTEPFQIGGKIYESEVPIYHTKEDEYYISCSELARHLGLKYKQEKSGLFRTTCTIGNQEFIVNMLSPGENFYQKTGTIFVRFAYFEQETELLKTEGTE